MDLPNDVTKFKLIITNSPIHDYTHPDDPIIPTYNNIHRCKLKTLTN